MFSLSSLLPAFYTIFLASFLHTLYHPILSSLSLLQSKNTQCDDISSHIYAILFYHIDVMLFSQIDVIVLFQINVILISQIDVNFFSQNKK
jgi:hypothetical protein